MDGHASGGVELTGRGLCWERRAVVLADMVESVRMIRRADADLIVRWCGFVDEVRDVLLPRHSGRLVKSLGDGLLLDFPNVRSAMQAAFALHRIMSVWNAGHPPELQMCLRVGCHVADIAITPLDIYGEGVNLTQRLSALAAPGCTVGSAAWREQLVDGVDVRSEDMGECFVKHIDEPVRAYRLYPPGACFVQPQATLAERTQEWRSGIAVVPFTVTPAGGQEAAAGDLIADGLILQMSLAKHLRVVSRLSSAIFRDRAGSAAEVGQRLGVHYVLSGRCVVRGAAFEGTWELAESVGESVVEAGRVRVPLAELVEPDCAFILELAQAVHDAVFRIEGQRARLRPLPNLDSYALLLGGIQLMHNSARSDFRRSFELLTHLSELHPRSSEPRLWLAKWYALRAVQGLTPDRAVDARLALDCIARALDTDPENPFARAMEGFVHCHLTQNYERAQHCLAIAVRLNPSESFGHLYQAVIHGLRADFQAGIVSSELARATSPLDPARYLFDSVAAYLHLGAGQLDRAIELARDSLRRNRMHAHTWRALTIAQVERGDLADAQESVRHLMDVQPGLTLQNYLSSGQTDDPVRRRFADALGRAGVLAQ